MSVKIKINDRFIVDKDCLITWDRKPPAEGTVVCVCGQLFFVSSTYLARIGALPFMPDLYKTTWLSVNPEMDFKKFRKGL